MIFVIVLVFVVLVVSFFQPLFLRRSYIDRVSRLDIPRTAQIIEYRFGIRYFDISPFFTKLQLNEEEFNILRGYFSNQERFRQEHISAFNRMKRDFNYTSVNIDNIAEIWLRDRMTSTNSFLVGSTRVIYNILITTNEGKHFLYVFYLR